MIVEEIYFVIRVVFSMTDYGYIERNFKELNEELSSIARAVGVDTPKLVCVTKSGSDEELLALASVGCIAIGENRPGELKRRGELLAEHSLLPELHQIGTLQSNKAKLVCEKSALIHSLDSISLAKEIDRQGRRLGRKIPALIEINSAEEPQKSGILPSDAEKFLEDVLSFEYISVSGLMTMGPAVDDAEQIRKYFRLTKKLFDELNSSYGFGDAPTLSMGMSDSFKVAIEEGSTLVRVGRRLFIK